MFLIVNPQYTIRNEHDCSYIIKKSTKIDGSIGAESKSVSLIPPFLGYILSNLGRNNPQKSFNDLSLTLGISTQSIENFVRKVTANENPLQMNGFSDPIIFPKRLIIQSSCPDQQLYHTREDVLPNSNFTIQRPKSPISINFMITNRCTTDCVYCYAQRDLNDELSTQEIINTIENAYSCGVINLTLTGGDIFALRDWPAILSVIIQRGNYPFLSTKTPLSSDEIQKLIAIGVKSLQFSLDSTDKYTLSKMLRVKTSYHEKVEQMFQDCSTYGIKITVRSVLTSLNSSMSQIENLLNFLNRFSCIESWVLTPAFYSESQKDYRQLEVTNDQLSKIYEYTVRANAAFPIQHNKMNETGYAMKPYATEEGFIRYNQKCYANSYSMSILASGKCTVCEMLYDNEDFIIGDIRNNTIEEIWNGNRALELYAKSQNAIEDKNTPCFVCKLYDECKNRLAKKVCYVDVAKINGLGKHEYPDPRCPRSIKTDVIL